MKKILGAMCAFVAAVGTLPANDSWNDGTYLNFIGGANFLEADHNRAGLTVGIAVGAKSGVMRIEGEFSDRYNTLHASAEGNEKKLDNGPHFELTPKNLRIFNNYKFHGNTYAVMGNLYMDVDLNCDVTPYIGAGVGFAWSNYSYKHKRIEKRVIECVTPEITEEKPNPKEVCTKKEPLIDLQPRPDGRIKNKIRERNGICYQGIAGISWAIRSETDVSVEYRGFIFQNHLRDNSCILSVKQYF